MAGNVVSMGAHCQCDQGATPTPLTVTSQQVMQIQGKLAATVMDSVPMTNVKPFGACQQSTPPRRRFHPVVSLVEVTLEQSSREVRWRVGDA